MATATERGAAPPPVAGAQPWQKVGWLPSGTELDWLDALAGQHRTSAARFGEAVDRLGRLSDAGDEEAIAHRAASREALLAGQTPPPPLDPAITKAKVEVAAEDVQLAEEALARVVTDALGQMRQRRTDLEPVLESFGDELLKVLLVGGGDRAGCTAILREQRAREVRRLDRVRSFSENIDVDPQAAEPLRERVSYA